MSIRCYWKKKPLLLEKWLRFTIETISKSNTYPKTTYKKCQKADDI